MTPSAERRSRTQAWLLVGVFFAPLLLAFLLYYSGTHWRPSGRTNRGELIQPPRPLPRGAHVDAPDTAGAQRRYGAGSARVPGDRQLLRSKLFRRGTSGPGAR